MVANENHTNFMSFRQKNKCMGKSRRREGKYDERRESAILMPYQIIFLYILSIWALEIVSYHVNTITRNLCYN